MGEIPFHQKPSFRILILVLALGGIYVYDFIWNGGILPNVAGMVLDGILLLLLLQVSVFFYAQFTLPVRNLRDRRRINSRLWLHWRKAHGPTVFVRNGRTVERTGEENRRGPGLVWVDTASAVVTQSGARLKDVLGPGIHFTHDNEWIAGTLSLHTQSCTIGPGRDEPIFGRLGEGASDEERIRFTTLQAGRTAVSGRTRDGNEVVPNITVVFKLDAEPTGPGMPGSRFGFSKEAVERAARAEGMKADSGSQTRVAWNQLPGLIVIDLWREYLSKFTLDELFSPTFPPIPQVPQPDEPVVSMALPSSPLIVRRNFLARSMRQLNNRIEQWLATKGIREEAEQRSGPVEQPEIPLQADSSKRHTALQIISAMMRARMTQSAVPILDDYGRVVEGHAISRERARLRERGLAILDVSVDNLRFDPAIEDQIIQQWNTTWLADATTERQQIEQLERLSAENGRRKALLDHALVLGQTIEQEKPGEINAAAKSLLEAVQNEMVADQRLFGRASPEVESVSTLLKWVEAAGHD